MTNKFIKISSEKKGFIDESNLVGRKYKDKVEIEIGALFISNMYKILRYIKLNVIMEYGIIVR